MCVCGVFVKCVVCFQVYHRLLTSCRASGRSCCGTIRSELLPILRCCIISFTSALETPPHIAPPSLFCPTALPLLIECPLYSAPTPQMLHSTHGPHVYCPVDCTRSGGHCRCRPSAPLGTRCRRRCAWPVLNRLQRARCSLIESIGVNTERVSGRSAIMRHNTCGTGCRRLLPGHAEWLLRLHLRLKEADTDDDDERYLNLYYYR